MIPINMQMDKLFEPENPGGSEYVDGTSGLIYCSKCYTARQVRIVVGGRSYTPRCLCTCQKERMEQEERKRRQQEFRDRISKNRSLGLQDPVLRKHTFENDNGSNSEISAKLKRYVDHWEEMRKSSMGLLLYGPTGTGKSFLCGCMANALLEQGVTVLMTNFGRVINTLTGLYSGDRNTYIDSLNRFDLLIIDDLGAERNTEYVVEQVFQVIDSRYRSQLPMILSTNLPLNELQNPTDLAYARIYDRVLERCVPLRVVGNSIRRRNAVENVEIARRVLGGK